MDIKNLEGDIDMKSSEKKNGKRIVLSVIAIAVIAAMVSIMILSAVRAEDGVPQSESVHDSHGATKEQAESEIKETAIPVQDQTSTAAQKEKQDIPEEEQEVKEMKRPGGDSSVAHIRRRPGVSPDYKKIEKIGSEFAVVLDADKNEIVAGKQAAKRMFPASLTKVMTLVTAVDFLESMDAEFSLTLEESDFFYREQAAAAGYEPGEKALAGDMLYGLILPSGADCALGLAKVTAGDEKRFADLMNLEAVKMGLRDTHFTNPVGLHDDQNYSTPIDLAVIYRYAMDNELCRKVLGTPDYTMEKTKEHPEGLQVWSHTFGFMTGVDMNGFTVTGGKVGYTQEARSCFVTSAEKNGRTFIVVTGYGQGNSGMCADHIEIYKNLVV